MRLREQIEAIAAKASNEFTDDDLSVFEELKRALNRGEVRALHLRAVSVAEQRELDANGRSRDVRGFEEHRLALPRLD